MPEYDLNKLLLTELLAMDVYHRDVEGGLVPLVRNLPQMDGVVEGRISDPSNIGFFAKAYQKDGTTYIVYRGTDDGSLDVIGNTGSIGASLLNAGTGHPDLYYGYPVAAGSLSSVASWANPLAADDYNSQVIEAVRFYQQIKDSTPGPIVVVGQSLGGGLAGFIGALYGIDAYVYNPAPFKLAVQNAYDKALNGDAGPNDMSLRQFLYGNAPPPLPSYSKVKGAYVPGEIIEVVSTRPYDFEQVFPDYDVDGYLGLVTSSLGVGGRHTASTLTTLLFGETLADKSWHDFARYIWKPWTDKAIAEAAGYPEVPIPNNKFFPQDVMAVAIAYTGAEQGGAFGDSAIRALFDDANELGKVYSGSPNSLLNDHLIAGVPTVKQGLAEIAVQYAGDLALQKATDSDSKAGVFELLDGDTKLKADLDPQKWINTFNIGVGADGNNRSGGQEKIVGIDKIATALIATMAAESSGSSQAAITQAAQKFKTDAGEGYRNITWLEAAAKTGGVTIAEPENAHPTLPGPGGQQSNDPGGAILIGGYGADTITGSKGHDLIIGGNSDDTFFWSGGNDLVFGGQGDDKYQLGKGDPLPGAITFFGGEGDDVLVAPAGSGSKLYGGEGKDIIVGRSGVDELYGNDGDSANDNDEDIFSISNQTFVYNAGTEDKLLWGPFIANGGVKTWWMEGQFAYSMPFHGLFSAMPAAVLPAVGALAPMFALGAQIDIFSSLMLRYALSASHPTSHQLVIQSFLGAGQAVVEDYKLDLESGEATAGIAVFKQIMSEGLSVAQIKEAVNLALKAGFGIGLDGKDPLILDLDGDGYDLVRRDSSGVYFDLDADGFAERTAWVAPDDGFLVRDLDGNGQIDDITEMFGTAATPGLTMLAALDSNTDGLISSADTNFATLKVWRDADGDGITDAGELQTLTEAGITQISLTSSIPSTGVVRGNAIRAESTFTRANGTTSKIGDVLLQTVEADTIHLGDNTISAAAAALPELKGYGELTSLRVAMTDDATLQSLVETLSAGTTSTTWADIKAATDDILFRWAGVEGVAATAIGTSTLDTRELAFLEAYFGEELMQRNAQGQIMTSNLVEVEQLWSEVLEATAIRLAAQGPWASLFTGTTYVEAADTFAAASATTLSGVYAAALGQLSSDPATAEQQWTSTWGPALAVFNGSMTRADFNAVRTDYVVMSLVQALAATASPLSLQQLVEGLALEGVHVGTAGSDTLARSGDLRTQVYVGDAGNDTMTGGSGQDVFVFGSNFGQDTIVDTEFTPSGDRVRLATLNADEVEIARVGDDLVITVTATGDKITVEGQYAEIVPNGWNSVQQPGFGIEDIQFADGTIWEAGEIAMAVGTGTSASETIEGTQREDILRGAGGNDTLLGGDSADIYWYEDGDGNDIIHDVRSSPLIPGADVLFINGAPTAYSISVSRDGASDDVVLTLDDGSTITIEDQFAYSPLGYEKYATDNRIEAVFFNDGPSWDWLELQRQVLAVYTTDGDDLTYGYGTPDELSSSAGDDFLSGFDGGDVYHFDQGTGNDTIHDAAKYILTPFSGLVGTVAHGDDVVEFGSGITLADIDFARVGSSDDLVITSAATGDTLTIVDQFYATSADIFGILGDAIWLDRIEEFRFQDGTTLTWQDVIDIVTTGDAGDNQLYGAYSSDTLDGKAGNDYLSGGELADTYIFDVGYGIDTIEDRNGNPLSDAPDRIKFAAGIVPAGVTFTREGAGAIPQDLRISINGASDAILIKNQYDVTETGPFGPHAFDAIELFEFADGTILSWSNVAAQLIASAATAGDDLIHGTHYDDIITGGAGNDTLIGWNGSDTYVINSTDGNETINDGRDTAFGGDLDKVVFGAGMTANNLVMTRSGTASQLFDLNMTFGSQTVTVEGQFFYSNVGFTPTRIEQFVFGDGSIWTSDQLRNEYLLRATTGDADTIVGFNSDDVISGGAGNDTLRGGDGNDTYQFAIGDGQDRIEESLYQIFYSDQDVIQLGAGILPANVTVSRPVGTNDLVISFAGTSDNITVSGQFQSAAAYGSWTDIETIRFADGTEWSEANIRQKLLDQARTSGNDTIIGFYTADTIDGGAGDDVLKGSAGSDSYIFGIGGGHDVIEEALDGNHIFIAGSDTIEFVGSVLRSDVTSARVGDDLKITITATGESISIKNHFSDTYARIETFKFSDGAIFTASQMEANAIAALSTAGDDVIGGGPADDVLDGGAGNDLLGGADGHDTYVFGRSYGQDTIDEDSGTFGELDDVVAFKAGVATTDIEFDRIGNDLIVRIAGTSDQLTIKDQFNSADSNSVYGTNRIERFVFADGTSWSAAEVDFMTLASAQTGGNDTVLGYTTNDVLDGGAGDDSLSGRDGDDTYHFGRGYGADIIVEDSGILGELNDIVVFAADVAPSDIEFSRTGNDLVLSISGTVDRLTIKDQLSHSDSSNVWGADRVESFSFGDGTVWSAADVDLKLLASQQSAGSDTIIGFTTNDTLDGLAGNDTLSGGDGDDTYVFGRGYGQDVIDENTGIYGELQDVVVFRVDVAPADLTLHRVGNDLVIKIAGTTDQLTIKDQFSSADSSNVYGTNRIERFQFADGTVWAAAEVDLRVLLESQTAGSDTVVGYSSNDVLTGGAGDDVLRGGNGDDNYVFEPGFGRDTIDEDTGIWGELNDQVVFRTGILPVDVLPERIGNDLILHIAGTSDQVRIVNQFVSANSAASAGADRIESFIFADGTTWSAKDVEGMLLSGTPATDTIIGFDSEDVLDGKGGNDILRGGTANDTYVYSRGQGNDTIVEAASGGTLDKLVLRDIPSTAISLLREGDHLTIVIAEQPAGAGNGGRITVSGQFAGSSSGIEQIVFSDGIVWSAQQIAAQAVNVWGSNAIVGDAAANSLTGTSIAEILVGKGGNDILRGNGGSDDYKFASGDGSDTIIEIGTGQTDVLTFVDLGRSDVMLSRDLTSRNDLVLTILATGEQITVDNQFYSTSYGIEEIRFADGVALNRTGMSNDAWLRGSLADETIFGTGANETIVGHAGNDSLGGQGGSDTYVYSYGDGSDIIDENNLSGTDVLSFTDVLSGDVIFSRDLTNKFDLVLTIIGTGQSITVDDQFVTGTYGLEEIRFAGGETLGRTQLLNLAWYRGTEISETIVGTSANETFVGGDGDDTLIGSTGDDTYVYASGDGSDLVDDGGTGAHDILKFTDLNAIDLEFSRASGSSSDMLIKDLTTGSVLTIDDQLLASSSAYGVAQIQFADGTQWSRTEIADASWIRGTSLDDTLSGSTANDTIQGKQGADQITSTYGSDTFIWATGDGNDWINEQSSSTTEIDTLKLVNLNPDDILLVHSGSDLLVNVLATNEVIEVDEHFYSETTGYGIERLEFADGTVWDRSGINAATWVLGDAGNNTISGTAAGDNIDGREGDDIISGGAGADHLIGGSGSDSLTGGDGDDILNGGDDDDTLIGGAGNDLVTGGYGDDVFIYAAGNGTDTITDFEAIPGQNAFSLNGDRIQISIEGIDTFEELVAVGSEQNGDIIFNFGNGDALIIQGTLLAALDRDAFSFY